MSLADLDRQHLWHPFTPHDVWDASDPLIIVAGDGCELIDEAGNRYVDGVSSLWTNVHGHRHPVLDAAVRAQLDRIAHSTLLGLSHPGAIELAYRLVAIAPPGLTRVFYSDNGSTAVEVALKVAFQYHLQVGNPGRTQFATLSDAYHGDTVGAVSLGGIAKFHALYSPLLFHPVSLPAPTWPGGDEEADCLARALALIEEHGPSLAAIVVEPLVQGAAGMRMHSERFLRTITDAARHQGALVIADEVAVGFGRLGSMFAVQHADVFPDLLCLAKGLSGGYLPLAATLATEAVFDAFRGDPKLARTLFHGHTYTGNPLACAAALATLDVFQSERTLVRVDQIETRLAAWLPRLGLPYRHKGVMVGIDLPMDGHRVAMACRAHGAITRPLGNTLVLNPPLSIDDATLDRLCTAVERAIADCA